jgi:hypothetical protein
MALKKNIPNLLSVLTISIHASVDPELFGLMVREEMAMRKPIRATNVG